MTPKEKAEKLVDKFINYSQQCINDKIINQFNLENPAYKGSKFLALMRFSEKYNAKQCALIAVDEIIKSDPRLPNDVDWDDAGGTHLYYHLAQRGEALEFWEQVKEEILKL